MDGSPHHQQGVHLPALVEAAIQRICLETKQPEGLQDCARKMLWLIGEQRALELLSKVLAASRSSKETTTLFSGSVARLMMDEYPDQAAQLGYYSSPLSASLLSKRHRSVSPLLQSGEGLQTPVNFSVNYIPSNRRSISSYANISCQLSFDDEDENKRRPAVRHRSSLPGVVRETQSATINQQLTILDKLEYRRLFLVLSYMGRQKLEAVVTVADAEDIYRMRNLSMMDFEYKIWCKYGRQFCPPSDRCQYIDWDSGKTHNYYCFVSGDGSYYFKGPCLNSVRTHLQRSLEDENVLIVKFLEDGSYRTANIDIEGILVGLRRFKFFVSKDDRKKAKKKQIGENKTTYSNVRGYFVRIGSISSDENYILSGKTIDEARRLFMHIHTLSTLQKYMARFSLILSKTTKPHIDLDDVEVERIDDIPFKGKDGSIIKDEDGKPILHTDGTGFISVDLAMRCSKDFYVKHSTDDDLAVDGEVVTCQKRGAEARNKELPLLIQCRLFYKGDAVKGTLLVNHTLNPGTIQVRPSMIKVERDENAKTKTINSLEIVTTSNRPGRNIFSKNLIALLSYGGVPQEFFLNLLEKALEEAQNVYSSRRAALRVASNHDGLQYGSLARMMISAGIPLNEPFLQICLSKLESGEKTKLKEGKIPVSDSFYLMGTADPTGLLENDEVCVILDSGQISGKVLVYRHPGMHFGDVHIMEAVYKKELDVVVGNAKYGIFFSTKGCRSAAYEMATGDFDGDKYWVSRNPELLKYFKPSEPWKRVGAVPGSSEKKNPQELSESERERELFKLFIEARRPSFHMSTAADSWLSFMDRLLTLGDECADQKNIVKAKMIELIDIYYDALDAPKTGKKVKVPQALMAEKYPHHMEKWDDISYRSSSVLGQIYDRAQAYKNECVLKTEIWKLSPFDVQNLIPADMYDMWENEYRNYRREMSDAMKSSDESKNEAANDVIQKYKQMLYEAPELEESAKNTQKINLEAMAIYNVVYDYAMKNGVEKCSFAWRVAGSALCRIYATSLPKDKPFLMLPSVLRELLN